MELSFEDTINTKIAEVSTQREAFITNAQAQVDKQLAFFDGQLVALRSLLPEQKDEEVIKDNA